MGRYIQTNSNHGKADTILASYPSAKEISRDEAIKSNPDVDGIVVVVNNGLFEAAAFAHNERELRDFTDPDDWRPKRFIKMDRNELEKIAH